MVHLTCMIATKQPRKVNDLLLLIVPTLTLLPPKKAKYFTQTVLICLLVFAFILVQNDVRNHNGNMFAFKSQYVQQLILEIKAICAFCILKDNITLTISTNHLFLSLGTTV